MVSGTQMGRRVGLLALAAALVLPASNAVAGEGPVATKSGAIVNFVTTGKLKVAKRIEPLAVCSVDCDVTGTAVLKGMGLRLTFAASRSFASGQQFSLFIVVKGRLLKVMKANPGKFRLAEKLTATDPATGATDSVSRSFKLKR